MSDIKDVVDMIDNIVKNKPLKAKQYLEKTLRDKCSKKITRVLVDNKDKPPFRS